MIPFYTQHEVVASDSKHVHINGTEYLGEIDENPCTQIEIYLSSKRIYICVASFLLFINVVYCILYMGGGDVSMEKS